MELCRKLRRLLIPFLAQSKWQRLRAVEERAEPISTNSAKKKNSAKKTP